MKQQILLLSLLIALSQPAQAATEKEPVCYLKACQEIHLSHAKNAHKLLMHAARQGHAKSQTLLAMMYQDGIGVEKDAHKAEMWYQKAAKQGLKEAENGLGHLYLSTEETIHNPKQAEQWLNTAAEHGVMEAQRDLGFLYLKGDLVGKDHDKAVHLLQSAASQGSQEAKAALESYPAGPEIEKVASDASAKVHSAAVTGTQGVNDLQTSWEGYGDLVQSMHAITADQN